MCYIYLGSNLCLFLYWMQENIPPEQWPPIRSRTVHATSSQESSTSSLITPAQQTVISGSRDVLPTTPTNPTPSSRLPLSSAVNTLKTRRQYRNGYECKPTTPSYKLYALNSRGHKRQRAYAFEDEIPTIEPMEPLSPIRWNKLARESNILPDKCNLRDFQMQCSDIVIGLGGDVGVISPTGSGKSLLWILPLLAQKKGISLMVTPYTNVGIEGEDRYVIC
jgi:ATP-dependent helicase YprA (DUF1998 family)